MMRPTVTSYDLGWVAEPGGLWICLKDGANCFLGNGERGMGNGEWGMGNREWGTGNG